MESQWGECQRHYLRLVPENWFVIETGETKVSPVFLIAGIRLIFFDLAVLFLVDLVYPECLIFSARFPCPSLNLYCYLIVA
jgi:hypothetical protein